MMVRGFLTIVQAHKTNTTTRAITKLNTCRLELEHKNKLRMIRKEISEEVIGRVRRRRGGGGGGGMLRCSISSSYKIHLSINLTFKKVPFFL